MKPLCCCILLVSLASILAVSLAASVYKKCEEKTVLKTYTLINDQGLVAKFHAYVEENTCLPQRRKIQPWKEV